MIEGTVGGNDPCALPVKGRAQGSMVSSTETGVLLGEFWVLGEEMTPPHLPMKGRNAGVYGFLDGNRGRFGGYFGC